MYIQTSSASAYCSFLHFLLFCLCIWLAINRNQYLRNATRMVLEFSQRKFCEKEISLDVTLLICSLLVWLGHSYCLVWLHYCMVGGLTPNVVRQEVPGIL